MGINISPRLCCFTDLPATDMPTDQDCYDYFINFNDKKVGFRMSSYFNLDNSKVSMDDLTKLRGDIL